MPIEIRRAVVADAESVLTLSRELADYQDKGAYVLAASRTGRGSSGATR